jgi:hypothetical protein
MKELSGIRANSNSPSLSKGYPAAELILRQEGEMNESYGCQIKKIDRIRQKNVLTR